MPTQKTTMLSYINPQKLSHTSSTTPTTNMFIDSNPPNPTTNAWITPMASRNHCTASTNDLSVASYPTVASFTNVTLNSVASASPMQDSVGGGNINMSNICRGCQNEFKHCMEREFRESCIHSVLDYFKEFGYNEVTKAGIFRVYYSTFMIHMKQKILKNSGGLYKTNLKIELPECMKQGSLKQAISMKNFNHVFDYFMGKRIEDV